MEWAQRVFEYSCSVNVVNCEFMLGGSPLNWEFMMGGIPFRDSLLVY